MVGGGVGGGERERGGGGAILKPTETTQQILARCSIHAGCSLSAAQQQSARINVAQKHTQKSNIPSCQTDIHPRGAAVVVGSMDVARRAGGGSFLSRLSVFIPGEGVCRCFCRCDA